MLRIRPSAGFTSCNPNLIILRGWKLYQRSTKCRPSSEGYIRGPQFSFLAINNRANNKSYSHFIYHIKFQMTPYAVVEFEDDRSIAIIHIQWFTGEEEAFACGHSQAIRVLSCCETVTILQQTGFHSPSGSLERPVCIPRHNII